MNIVFLMAGEGKRFSTNYKMPKPLIVVENGLSMIEVCVKTLDISGNNYFVMRKLDHEDDTSKIASVLKLIDANAEIIELNELTEGPACSAMAAAEILKADEPLIVTNCDQVLKWDSLKFQAFINKNDYDGVVVTYNSDFNQNSYVEIGRDGYATRFAEKEVISKYSLSGVHYWRSTKLFMDSVNLMIKKNIRVNGEFYIAPSYNELVCLGYKIGIYHLEDGQHFPLGTPDDLVFYQSTSSLGKFY